VASDTSIYDRDFPDSGRSHDPLPDYSATAIVARDRNLYPKTKPHVNKTGPALPRSRSSAKGRTANSAKFERYSGIENRIIGSSPQIKTLREQVLRYAPEEAPVCIFGETGVGKELVAEELHRYGRRSEKIFLPINAGAIPETLATAELFGHQKGSFTGAHVSRAGAFLEANGGTLYLDEIGEMPKSIQAQLLRVLDDGKVTPIGSQSAEQVNVRLITATNRDLRKCVAKGKFRRDLFYRINVLPIYVPSLRERGDDVIEIAEHMIRNHENPDYQNAVLTPRAIDRIKAHRFPGNARELRNLVSRAVIHARGGKITPDHLTFDCDGAGACSDFYNIADAKTLMGLLLASRALSMTQGNATKAAELTGLTRSSFHKIKHHLNGKDYAAQSTAIQDQLKTLLDG